MGLPPGRIAGTFSQETFGGLTLCEGDGDGLALAIDGGALGRQAYELSEANNQEVTYHQRGAITGVLLGILVFLAGIAIVLFTFKLAYTMFNTDPATLLNIGHGQTLDLSKAATVLMGALLKVVLLVVMVIIGGVVANRGIHLYANSRSSAKSVIIKEGGDRGGRGGRRKGSRAAEAGPGAQKEDEDLQQRASYG